MSVVKQLDWISVDAYLQGEVRAEQKHEYVNGAVYAMVGASARHTLIAGTIAAALRQHTRSKGCHVFQSDMKVRIRDAFYYPDVVVTCGDLDLNSYYQTDPVLVIEVLSESTEAKDRLEKRVAYQSIIRLQEYALVSQDKMQVEVIRRDGAGWQVETSTYNDRVRFTSLGFECALESLYEDVIRTAK